MRALLHAFLVAALSAFPLSAGDAGHPAQAAQPSDAPPATTAPSPDDVERLPNARSRDSLDFENELLGRSTRIVLLMASVKGRGGTAPLDHLLGDAGILADSSVVTKADKEETVVRVTGRAAEEAAVSRFLSAARRTGGVEILWVATCLVPPGAKDPIPLETLVWSPRMYPSKGSMVYLGPTGRPTYYVPGTDGEVVEGSWNGKDFQTAYYSLKRPPYVEGGGGPSINLSALAWRGRVDSWVREQAKLRQSGWEKYGYIFENLHRGDDSAAPAAPPSSNSTPNP